MRDQVKRRSDGLQFALLFAPVWLLIFFDDSIGRAIPTGSLNNFLMNVDSWFSGLLYQVPDGCPDETILRTRIAAFELLAWLMFLVSLSLNTVVRAYKAKRVEVGIAVAKIGLVHFVLALALLMILTQVPWVNASLDSFARYRWDVREVSCFNAPTRLPIFIYLACLASVMIFSDRATRRIQPT